MEHPSDLRHPYGDLRGEWVRGNLHAHSDEYSGCATVPMRQAVRKYREVGAGFMAFTDHDHVTDVAELRDQYPDMIFLEGFEYSRRENVLFLGLRVPDLYNVPLEQAFEAAEDLMTMLCHPDPMPGIPYWTLPKIRQLPCLPDGVEIYNGHYGTPMMRYGRHQPLYTHFWDELLTAGYRFWGYANDDFHDPVDFNNAFNMVLLEEATETALLAALRAGRCYASTGLLLKNLRVDGPMIEVQTAAHCKGAFIGPGGVKLAEKSGARFSYTVTDEEYVRFEASGYRGHLWLQPFFRWPPTA